MYVSYIHIYIYHIPYIHICMYLCMYVCMFYHPLLTSQPATMTKSAQTTIPPNHQKALGLSCSKIKWHAICIQINQEMLQSDYLPDSQGQETFLTPSVDKQTCNFDKECSNLHPSQSKKGTGIEP